MQKDTFEKGISTPLLAGVVLVALLIIGGFLFWSQPQSGDEAVKENIGSVEQQQEEQEEEIDTAGLIIEDIVEGSGEEIIPGDVLEIQYVGSLEDGTEFDSSIDSGKPLVFQFGVEQEILGWDLGMEGMKVGGKRKLTIPPHLAYGQEGVGDIVPPNATLTFEIEILKIIEVKG